MNTDRILLDWDEYKKELGDISNGTWVELGIALGDTFRTQILSAEQCVHVARFMYDVPNDLRMTVWSSLQQSPKNLMSMHRLIAMLMVYTATGKDISTLPRP